MNCEPEKIKIIYNPYAQKAAYKRWSNGAWIDLGSNSQLNSEQYQNNITLQNRGIDIVRQILEDYDDGTIGVNLVFEGTDNDFDDLQNILTLYFPEPEYKIDCTCSDKRLISADDAAQEIESIFAKMEQTFEENPSEELQTEIDRYKKTVKSTVTVCILGTYSAGKSAFINALIGEEILPCASDPSTATIYRVHTAQESKIKFEYKTQNVELNFSSTAYKPSVTNLAGDKLLSMIKANIENGDIHSCSAHMYYALEAINNFAKDTQSSGDAEEYPTIIDVYVPFRNSILPLDKHDFVFIDTPGADSETFKEHLDVTRDALKSQTCGLPIIITKPDDMDKAGNALVNNLLENNGGALDISNTIVIVNQSDDKTPKTLREKKAKMEDLCIARWHSNRIFFVSAAMGIAGKKDDADNRESWLDGDLRKVYRDAKVDFTDETEEADYMRLYLYNIIPDNRWEDLCRQAEAAPESERMLYNSGIRSVEDEIGLFAKKYAGYNKCTQARKYLERALEITQKSIGKSQEESKTFLEQIKQNIDEKAVSLTKKIEDSSKTLKEDTAQKTAIYIVEHAPSTDIIQNLQKELDKIWEGIQQDSSVKFLEKRKVLVSKITPQYSNAIRKYLNQLQNVIEDSASSASAYIKDSLCRVVNESDFINQSTRDKLKPIILDYPVIVPPQDIRLMQSKKYKFRILGFELEFEEKLSSYNMHKFVGQQFDQQCTEYMSIYTRKYQNSLEEWIDALSIEVVSNLSEFSPALRGLNDQLKSTMRKQEQLSENQKKLLHSSKKIENLLETEEEY